MKEWMMNVLRGFGVVFLLGGAIIALAEIAQIVLAVLAREKHELHWDPWLIAMGVSSFGGLLWQTGKITETLTEMGKAVPSLIDYVKSRVPGGRRNTDPPPPPVVSPPGPMEGQ